MVESSSGKPFDLGDRTFLFAKDVRAFVRKLRRTISNEEDIRQLVRSSGSVGANYIEANESLGAKDCLLRFRTSRKEAKESAFWLRLLDVEEGGALAEARKQLVAEAGELVLILSAIIKKRESAPGA